MSQVTNIVFTCDSADLREVGPLINRYFEDSNGLGWVSARGFDFDGGRHAEDCARCRGGNKCLEAPVAVGAFNGLDDDDFMAYLASLPWKYPDRVQILIKRQEDERFELLGLPEKPAPKAPFKVGDLVEWTPAQTTRHLKGVVTRVIPPGLRANLTGYGTARRDESYVVKTESGKEYWPSAHLLKLREG